MYMSAAKESIFWKLIKVTLEDEEDHVESGVLVADVAE